MKLIDLHADTLTAMFYNPEIHGIPQEFTNTHTFHNLDKNTLHIDLDKLKQADSLAQFFVLWLNLQQCHQQQMSPWQLFEKQYQQLIYHLRLNHQQITHVTNLAELELNLAQHKLSAFIGVEEGAFITNLEQLTTVQQMGIRYITLVWNYETHIGVPSAIDQQRGLTDFGKNMVDKMQQLGIIVDVSHLSDQGVKDVVQISQKPLIASHSNARSICNHSRNLPDELITKIANTGGVIGVNCVPYFLKQDNKLVKYEYLIEHIKHIYQIGGIDCIAIGNDFDGFKLDKQFNHDITAIADVPQLVNLLEKNHFTITQIEQIFHNNVLRIIKETIS